MDLEEFKYGGTNITALRLLDPERSDVQRVVRDWVYEEARKGRKLQLGHSAKVIFDNHICIGLYADVITRLLKSNVLFSG